MNNNILPNTNVVPNVDNIEVDNNAEYYKTIVEKDIATQT